MNEPTREEALAHFGVKGMKWGVRKDSLPGVSARTNREAKKDATEFTKAKLFYGEGAGNRRKLIKATVEAKSKRDPSYKKAFDHHVNNTDLSKRASQARSERKRKDVKKSAGRTARGIKNLALGTGATTTVAAAALYYSYQNPQVRSVVQKAGKTTIATAKQAVKNHQTRTILRNAGLKL